MATHRHIGFFSGEDKPLSFTVTGSDITGWSLSFQVKALAADETPLVSKATGGDGIVLTTPTSGICTVTVDAADTVDLDQGIYVYELKRTDSGFKTVLFYGTCRIQRSVHG